LLLDGVNPLSSGPELTDMLPRDAVLRRQGREFGHDRIQYFRHQLKI
jgi:hypothetical protein